MKKSLIALAVLVMAGSAFAQNVTGVNNGSINNTVKTNASVTGPNSTSFSYAAGAAGASSSVTMQWGGTPNTTLTGGPVDTAGLNASISGNTSTYNNSAAGNVTTGSNATGSASSTGWGVADVTASYGGTYTYTGNGGTTNGNLNLTGDANSGNGSDTNHNASGGTLSSGTGTTGNGYGTSINIVAGVNQGASAGATTSGAFTGNGYVGSNITAGTTIALNGSVVDTKTSSSSANTGTLTLNGTGMSNAATQNANAGTVVNVTGSFQDPIQP